MERSQARDFFRDVIAMAPMAMGGNLPYRVLCRQFGAVRTCSEMVLSDKLVKGGERPLIRHHPSESDFGVQLAGKRPEVMAEAARIAIEHGANFIDLNFGCPIDLIVRRGSGAALLKRPTRLGEIVAAVRGAVDVPLSVKLRLGYSEAKLNVVDLASRVQDAGADAVGVHGRTRNQRYRLNARWDLIDEVARAVEIPVLGNGDLLTPWDLEHRRAETTVTSFLVARGALIKPWIFRELAEGRPWDPSVPERWAILRRYLELALEYFGDDEKGTSRARKFFLWHWKFWHRYRPWSADEFAAHWPDSLMQARNPRVEGDPDAVLLASTEEAAHEIIWQRVLDRDFPAE
ncbi:MAG: tRNA-dihydrouridine synthase family protein [Candidatus Krumholzibacteriota bacterium]